MQQLPIPECTLDDLDGVILRLEGLGNKLDLLKQTFIQIADIISNFINSVNHSISAIEEPCFYCY